MTYSKLQVRSGLTAIAAVLALSSTPLLAQEVETPPDPAPESQAEPAPASDPLAPEPTTSEPVSEPAASEAEPAATAAPATTRRAPARPQTTTDRAASEPVRTAAPASTPQPTETPTEAMPVPPLPTDPATEPVAPLAAEPTLVSNDLMADEMLPIAGAAGLGLLALGGLGLAMQRRRRRREEVEHYRANQKYLDEHPVEPTPARREPAFFRTDHAAAGVATSSPTAAVRSDVPRTKLPSGFDLSRFGPHVRAAYLGPTPDNPSLSLKHRLRRAGAMDQRARLETAIQPQAEQTMKRPQPAKQPMWNVGNDGFMLRRAPGKPPLKPAFQH